MKNLFVIMGILISLPAFTKEPSGNPTSMEEKYYKFLTKYNSREYATASCDIFKDAQERKDCLTRNTSMLDSSHKCNFRII